MTTIARGNFWTLAVLLTLIFFSGCAEQKEANRGPKESLSGYLDAVINGRVEEAYQYLSSGDKEKKSFKDFAAEWSDEEGFIRGALSRKITFAVREMVVSGSRARASVDITAPDFERILADVLANLDREAFPQGNLEAHVFVSGLLGRQVKRYRDKGIPMRTTTEIFELVEEAGNWKIASNLNGQDGRNRAGGNR